MDLNKLEPGDRLLIWQRLKESPDWALVCDELRAKRRAIKEITDADSREAFLYAAIKQQAFEEVLDLPDTMIHSIAVNLPKV